MYKSKTTNYSNGKNHLETQGRIMIGCINGIEFTIRPKRKNKWYEIITISHSNDTIIHDFVMSLFCKYNMDIDYWAQCNNESFYQAMRYAAAEARNPSVTRKPNRKIPTNRTIKNTVDRDYIEASRNIYGNYIDYGEKRRSMNESGAAYLDGNQPRNSYDCYRPLTTSFPTYPEKSHKKSKRK